MPEATLATTCHWILHQEPSAIIGRSPLVPANPNDTLSLEARGAGDLRVFYNDQILSSEKNTGRKLGGYAVYMSPFSLLFDMHNFHRRKSCRANFT